MARFNVSEYTGVSFDLLEEIKICQQNICDAYIKGEVFVEFDEPAEMCLPEPKGPLQALN